MVNVIMITMESCLLLTKMDSTRLFIHAQVKYIKYQFQVGYPKLERLTQLSNSWFPTQLDIFILNIIMNKLKSLTPALYLSRPVEFGVTKS